MCATKCCPDCDNIDLSESFFNPHDVGNRVCSHCHGEGVVRTVIDDIAEGLGDEQDYEEGADVCPECGGDGECKTCDGEGVVDEDDDDNGEGH